MVLDEVSKYLVFTEQIVLCGGHGLLSHRARSIQVTFASPWIDTHEHVSEAGYVHLQALGVQLLVRLKELRICNDCLQLSMPVVTVADSS